MTLKKLLEEFVQTPIPNELNPNRIQALLKPESIETFTATEADANVSGSDDIDIAAPQKRSKPQPEKTKQESMPQESGHNGFKSFFKSKSKKNTESADNKGNSSDSLQNESATLYEMFKQTPVPDELSPDMVHTVLKPKFVEKKSVPTADDIWEDSSYDQAEAPIQQEISVEKPTAQNVQNDSTEQSSDAQEKPKAGKTGASDFIKIVFYHKLSRNEFLSLLGNSKISNRTYEEIRDNPGLTVKGLITILEQTSLQPDDYKKLIIAAERIAQLKESAKAQISSDAESPVVPAHSSKPKLNLNQLVSPKTQEVPTLTKSAKEEKVNNPVNGGSSEKESVLLKDETVQKPKEDSEDFAFDREDEEESKKSKKKLLFGKRDDEDDDEYDDDSDKAKDKNGDEDDWDDEENKPSKKKKAVGIAVALVALIGISIGVRYFQTGSVFSGDKKPQVDVVKELNENEIFNLISGKSDDALTEYKAMPEYTVGGIAPRQILKQSVTTDKRLLYIFDNSLYIFELIGGQPDKLDIRNYPSDVKLLGLIQTDKGIVVVSTNNGQPYSFNKTALNSDGSSEAVTDTVTRPETMLELLDLNNPEKRDAVTKCRISGTLLNIYTDNNNIVAVTSENLPQNCIADDYSTFMPYSYLSDSKKLCAGKNVCVIGQCSHKTITSVFEVDFSSEVKIAAAAGNAAKTSFFDGKALYLGAGSNLIRIGKGGEGIKFDSYSLGGNISDFSALSIYQNSNNEEIIRLSFEKNGKAAVVVLNGEFTLINEVDNLGNGEKAVATCFYKDQTFIVTDSGNYFGIDNNNASITAGDIKITNSKLHSIDAQTAVKLTPTEENGKRSGITVSAVKLDGTLTELGSAVISSKTVAKDARDEYLSSPAENNIQAIGSQSAADNSEGLAVIPVVYFDGVSQVELFVIYSVGTDGALTVKGSFVDYDRRSKNIIALVRGDFAFGITDKRITSARASDGNVFAYYDITDSGTDYSY